MRLTQPPGFEPDAPPGHSGGWLATWWGRVKDAAFPPGAITFHLGVWTSRRVTAADTRQVARLMAAHGLERLLVVHGNAIEVNGRVVLLAGSSRIGKSTACMVLEERGDARVLEEGLVLLGAVDGRWVVVGTGTFSVLRSASRIRARLLRRFPAAVRPPWISSPTSRWNRAAANLVNALAFRLAVLRNLHRRVDFRASVRDVAGLAVAVTPADAFPSLLLDARGSVEVIGDLLGVAPAGVSTLSFSALGNREESLDRLVQAILAIALPVARAGS
jgi:hypothetical protein